MLTLQDFEGTDIILVDIFLMHRSHRGASRHLYSSAREESKMDFCLICVLRSMKSCLKTFLYDICNM